jgi:hypothetical protein
MYRARHQATRLIFSLLAATLIPACGSSGSGGGGNNAPPPPPPALTPASVTITTPVGAQSGEVTINYTLIQAQSVTSNISVAFSLNGGTTFAPATTGPGGDGKSGLASSPTPGTAHTFVWNSLADLGAVNNSTVQFQITPNDGLAGTAVATTNFTVNNVGTTAPSVTITTPAAAQSGLVGISYMLIDAQSDPCSLTVQFSSNGGATFAPATSGPGGAGTSNVSSSPSPGTAHFFIWNSVADLGAVNSTTVQIQITPSAGAGLAGTAVATTNFTVNNAADTSGTSIGGGFPVVQAAGDTAFDIATDGNNLYIFGCQFVAAGDFQWRIEKRVCSTGALVAGFGTGGVVNSNPGPGDDGSSMHILIDGAFMYLLGARETANGSNIFNYYLEKRTLSTGALVTAFNSTGTLTGSSLGTNGPLGFAIDSTSIYLVMGFSGPDSYGQIEKLDKTTGVRVTGFGTGGIITENPTANQDVFVNVVTDGTNLYIVGAQNASATIQNASLWIEKRLVSDGSLVAAFGTGGAVVEAPPAATTSFGAGIAQDGTSLYILDWQRPNAGGNQSWHIEKRSMTDGSLTTSVTSALADTGDGGGEGGAPNQMVLSGTSLYFFAQTNTGTVGDDQWWIEKRKTADLTLDATFGTAGVVLSNPTAAKDGALRGTVTGGILYGVGFQDNGGAHEWRIEARWK